VIFPCPLCGELVERTTVRARDARDRRRRLDVDRIRDADGSLHAQTCALNPFACQDEDARRSLGRRALAVGCGLEPWEARVLA
jgi:hypothetical protein